ncbi:hypothetical protein AALP_AAs44002U000100 [Arabis alpina]|uniref:Uncharacterized protein n=1 Tax=Arabis alpina TaxID=50452 RepID=A0A087FZ65_ARAAL|nr:hypothetical protein AALP_AAs44002U000100 [Arabis alpina]
MVRSLENDDDKFWSDYKLPSEIGGTTPEAREDFRCSGRYGDRTGRTVTSDDDELHCRRKLLRSKLIGNEEDSATWI